ERDAERQHDGEHGRRARRTEERPHLWYEEVRVLEVGKEPERNDHRGDETGTASPRRRRSLDREGHPVVVERGRDDEEDERRAPARVEDDARAEQEEVPRAPRAKHAPIGDAGGEQEPEERR